MNAAPPSSQPRFASIKRLILFSGLLIAAFTLALIPVLSTSVQSALLRQAEQYSINELYHLNSMQWQTFMSPVLVENQRDPALLAKFHTYLSTSTQGPTIQTLTVYDRTGQRIFGPAQGGSNLAPAEAVAAMSEVRSVYTTEDGQPVLESRIPIAADGSIPSRAEPLPNVAPPMYHGAGPDIHAAPLAAQPVIGLLTLNQNLQTTSGVLQQFQWRSEVSLVLLMGGLFVALLFAMRRTESILALQYSQLEAQNSALQRLERTKEELTNMLVHDLRNPVTAMLASLDILGLPEIGQLNADQAHIITQARQSGARMTTMINDLLVIRRLEDGQPKLERQPFVPATELARIEQTLQPLAEQSRHQLRLSVAADAPTAQLDGALIERVIGNLVGNALKHTPAGTEVVISAAAVGDELELRVSDNGPGIPAAEQSQIFERWGQGSQHGSGHGLGLTFCQLAVAAHGGTLRLESDVGQGASFVITLPLAAGAAISAAPADLALA